MSTRGTHPVNTTYLVLGIVLIGLAGSWLLRETGVLDADGFRWLLPLVLVVAGAAGLLATLARSALQRRGAGRAPAASGDEDDDLRVG